MPSRRPGRTGERALNGQRKSLPSLLMVSRDLTKVLNERYPAKAGTRRYLDHLDTLSEDPKRLSLWLSRADRQP